MKILTEKLLALTLVTLLFPYFLLITVLHLCNTPVFYIQKRIGLDNKVFKILKLRSMFGENHPRLNKLGLFLRKSSIDELPQLINILKGEMSFIGPRPLLPEYLEAYSSYQIQRHLVKPGITGLAQIKGLNDISWSHKFRYDVFYTRHLSISLDCYIVWKTIRLIVSLQRFKPERNHTQAPFIHFDQTT